MAIEARHEDHEGDALVGTQVGGRYRIERRLGEGGAGVVYDAVHEELDRPVAIKVLGAAWAYDPNAVARFEREARAASRVGHRHIVDVYDLGRLDDGRPYLIMERLHGEPLDAVLYRRGRLPPRLVASLVTQAASALDAVHRRGIVHRDIKPENLFLVYHEGIDEPEVKLLDFGLAAIAQPDGDQRRLTVQGMVYGTPHYMAPEATGSDLPDHRADIYSLAVMAYELLTGVVPFDSSNLLHILTRKTAEEAPSLEEATGEAWSEELEQVFAKALSRKPSMRQQSAGELARALTSACESPRPTRPTPPGSARPPPGDPSAAPAGDSPSRAVRTVITRRPPGRGGSAGRARWGWVAVAVVSAAAIGGGLAWLSGADADRPNVARTSPPAEPNRPPDEPVDDEMETAADQPVDGMSANEPEAEAAADGEVDPVGHERTPPRTPERDRARRARPRPTAAPPAPAPEREEGISSDGEAESAVEPDEPPPRLADQSRARARELTREGTAAMLQGRLPDAIRRFRDATLAHPRHAPAWRGLGLANERLGRAPEATRAYRRYLALAPGAPDAAEVRRRLDALD